MSYSRKDLETLKSFTPERVHAFSVKSVETVLTGGIYFGAGMIFIGLTYGIFAALGIEIAEKSMLRAVAFNIGVSPLLALASVYNPLAVPVVQNWTSGLTRLLSILTRLLLPLALGVLAVYVLWFIPAYFWRPFEEREVLLVYNATIIAILVLIALTVADTHTQFQREQMLLHQALRALSTLVGLLNIYALAAIIYRISVYGLTPNRYVVIGWNVTTLLMLSVVVFILWRAQKDRWMSVVREFMGRVSFLAIIWSSVMLLSLPFLFF